MPHFSVLYDGWPLIYQPDSPEALHLMAILSCHLDDIQAQLALPAAPPAWLPAGIDTHVQPTANLPQDRLAWEQRTLPRLRQQAGAALLHLTSPNPPLFGPAVNVVSPSTFSKNLYGESFASRLRQAASQGGMARLAGLFWPNDLPSPTKTGQIYRIPAVIPGFQDLVSSPEDELLLDSLELPEAYVIYHGPPDERALQDLLGAWSWVSGPLGDAYPLLAIGLGEAGRERLATLAWEYDLGETVRSLPALPTSALGPIYQRGAALLHPMEEPPWGGPVRLALANGKPVVSFESETMSALVGPAAYLVKTGDARAMGAALITILVEEEVAGRLAQAARQRAESWSLSAFAGGLAKAYQDILDKGR